MVKTTLPYNGQVFQKLTRDDCPPHVCKISECWCVVCVIHISSAKGSKHSMFVTCLEDVNRCKQESIQTLKSKYSKIYVTMYQPNCVSQNEVDKNIDMSFAGLEILFHETLSLSQVVVPSTFVVSVGLLPDSDGRGLGVLPSDVFCILID